MPEENHAKSSKNLEELTFVARNDHIVQFLEQIRIAHIVHIEELGWISKLHIFRIKLDIGKIAESFYRGHVFVATIGFGVLQNAVFLLLYLRFVCF